MNIKSEKLFKVLSISIFIMYLILVVWVVISSLFIPTCLLK